MRIYTLIYTVYTTCQTSRYSFQPLLNTRVTLINYLKDGVTQFSTVFENIVLFILFVWFMFTENGNVKEKRLALGQERVLNFRNLGRSCSDKNFYCTHRQHDRK
jgi:hypothetical protein